MRTYAFLALSLILFIGCNPQYLNKKYVLQNRQEIKLAILPSNEDMGFEADSIFKLVFKQGLQNHEIIYPGEIRSKALKDKNIELIIMPIINAKDTITKLNLTNLISKYALSNLKSEFNNSDLLLVPHRFAVRQFGPNVVGYFELRLYDLENGELIFESNGNNNSSPDGMTRTGGLLFEANKNSEEMQIKIENDAYLITDWLVKQAYKDYNKYFIKNQFKSK
jgi:hypothetical protein